MAPPKIIVAPGAGFCRGVRRAVEQAEELMADGARLVSLGPLMHCPQEVERLEGEGLAVVAPAAVGDDDAVLVRTHGATVEQLEHLESRAGGSVHDATCSRVRACQTIAGRMAAEGYGVVVVGVPGHAELDAVLSHARGRAGEGEQRTGRPAPVLVVSAPDELDLPALEGVRRVAVLAQTTVTRPRYREVVAAALDRFVEVRAFDTICDATGRRQRDAERLAQGVDLVVVVGGRNSANTTRLAETCAAITATHHVETEEDLEAAWFEGAERVLVTAGASTPGWLIDRVVQRLGKL